MMDLRGEKVAVVGLGRSALGAVRLLLREGAAPFVTDSGDGPGLAPYCGAIAALGVDYEVGGHTDRAFDGAALAVVSPGVAPKIPLLEGLREKGVPVVGELELGSWFCPAPMLAVTGTNGKTTTTELIRCMLECCGRTAGLAGNNDTPLSEAVLADPLPEFMVVEVSSYQLETARTFHPWVAAVLNLTPDHLGRHGDMAGYAAEKARIFAQQDLGDIAVINADDSWAANMVLPESVRRVTFSLDTWALDGVWADETRIRAGDDVLGELSDVALPGRHNLANALAATAMLWAGGFETAGMIAGLRRFPGVEHRIERVCGVAGVPYFNDSKSTNIDSLRVALESFTAPVVLIAGGRGKGADYAPLQDLVGARVKALVTLGEDAGKLEAAFSGVTRCVRAGDMGEAVAMAARAASAGDMVLLSPGCASFDMYANFEERGHDFKAKVHRLAESSAGEGSGS